TLCALIVSARLGPISAGMANAISGPCNRRLTMGTVLTPSSFTASSWPARTSTPLTGTVSAMLPPVVLAGIHVGLGHQACFQHLLEVFLAERDLGHVRPRANDMNALAQADRVPAAAEERLAAGEADLVLSHEAARRDW